MSASMAKNIVLFPALPHNSFIQTVGGCNYQPNGKSVKTGHNMYDYTD